MSGHQTVTTGHIADDADLGQIARGIRRFLPSILWFTITVALTTALILHFVPARYTSNALVLIDPTIARLVGGSDAETPSDVSDERIANEIEVMRSLELSAAVMDELGLWEHPEYRGGGVFAALTQPAGAVAANPRTQRIERFQRQLSIFRKGKSAIIAVEFTADDPMRAADVANALADAYLRKQTKQQFALLDENITRLSGQVSASAAKVAELESNVLEFRARNRLLTNQPAEHDAATLGTLERDLLAAQLQSAELRDSLHDLESRPAAVPEGAGATLLNALEQTRIEKQEKSAAAQKIYGRLHPESQQLRASSGEVSQAIAHVQTRELGTMRSAFATAESNVRLIQGKIRNLQGNLAAKQTSLTNIAALERELDFNRKALSDLQGRLNDATQKRDAAGLGMDKLVLSRGYAPSEPSAPLKLPILALTAVGALLLGLLYAMFKGAYTQAPTQTLAASSGQLGRTVTVERPKAPQQTAAASIRGVIVSSLRSATPEVGFAEILKQLAPEHRLIVFRTNATTTRTVLLPIYAAKAIAAQKPGHRVLIANLDPQSAPYLDRYKTTHIRSYDGDKRFFQPIQVLVERALYLSTLANLRILDLAAQRITNAQLTRILDEVSSDYSHIILLFRDGSKLDQGPPDRDLRTPNRFLVSEADEVVYRLPDAPPRRSPHIDDNPDHVLVRKSE